MNRMHWPLAVLLCWLPLAGAGSEAENASVEALIEALQSKDLPARRNAAYDLDQLGRQAAPAVAALMVALDDADQQVWSRSASA